MARYRQERLTSSLKRSLYGPTLKPIETDYTMKEINSLLSDLLGKPGVSAGRAQQSLNSSIASGMNAGAYSSAQMDVPQAETQSSGGGATAIGAGIGLIRDLIGYYHADKAAEVAFDRQNKFYDEHLSMSAKVKEYDEAGLNPMGLAGAGVGATSAPSVNQGATPSGSSMVDVLGQLLNYKLKSRELDIQSRVADADIELKKSSTEVNTTTINKIVAETGKIFSETSKIDAEAYILQMQGKYADQRFKAELDNLLKDLDLKGAQINKTDAEAANAWIIANYQTLQQEAEIALKNGQSFASYARGALDKYTKDFASSHDGALPYSGEVAAVIAGLGTLLGKDGKGIVETVKEDIVDPMKENLSDQALIKSGKESVEYVKRDSTGTSEFRRDMKKLFRRRRPKPYTTYGP